jgi:hypothetical protein
LSEISLKVTAEVALVRKATVERDMCDRSVGIAGQPIMGSPQSAPPEKRPDRCAVYAFERDRDMDRMAVHFHCKFRQRRRHAVRILNDLAHGRDPAWNSSVRQKLPVENHRGQQAAKPLAEERTGRIGRIGFVP